MDIADQIFQVLASLKRPRLIVFSEVLDFNLFYLTFLVFRASFEGGLSGFEQTMWGIALPTIHTQPWCMYTCLHRCIHMYMFVQMHTC